MSVYDDKMNQEMLKVVCDLNRLIAEAVKVTGVTILNALTNKSMKDKLDIHGHFNNYDVLSVTGLSMDEAKALLKEKKKIIANGFYDRGGHYILAIKRSDFDKISELEKEIADGTLDVDDFLEEYRKNKSEQEHGHSSDGERPNGMPDQIGVHFDEVPEDAPELTEEDFEQGGNFEVNFNPEEVVQNIENEKANEIENEVAAEEAVDHNNDFATGERNEAEVSESTDIPQTEEDIKEPDISPVVPPVQGEDVEGPSVENQNIDSGDEHAPEATEESLREDSDNAPSIPEKLEIENNADIEEQRGTEADKEPEQRVIDANSEFRQYETEKSADDRPDNSHSEEHREKSEYSGESNKENSSHSEEHKKDSVEQYTKPDESFSEEYKVEESDNSHSNGQSVERQNTLEHESHNEEVFDRSALAESSATDRSGENTSYRNNDATTYSNEGTSNTRSIETNGSEQPRSATQSAETEKKNDSYSGASNRSQNDHFSSEQKTSRSVSLDERDRREKEEAIQKQIDRRERRENVTVTEVGTGASLFSSYGDVKDAEQLHAADKDNRVVFSDHREMRFETKSEIFNSKIIHDEKSSNKGTLAYKEQTNNSYTLPSSPSNSMESKTNVQFNKLTLVNRYTGNVATDMVKSVGTVFVGSIEEGHRESMQGQGKAQMSGISTYINNIGYSNLASVKRDALIRKTQRELNSGTGAYGQLNQLLKTKGFVGIDFSSRKQAGASMEDIYKMLQRSGMASNRSGVWDLTKFDRLYRRARKGNDYSEIARALGISSISKAEMKLIGEQIHQIVRRDRTGRKSTEGAVSTRKTLRSMMAHKLGQDSQVLAGYMNIKQTVQTVRSTAKAAWLMAVTTGRVIGKLGKWTGCLIGFGANTRLLRDTAFGKGYRKIDSGAKKIGGKIDDLKNHHREKKDKKDSEKEKKKTNEKKKREDRQKARRNARQARFASLAGKWNRFAPGFLRSNSFIGRTVGNLGKAVARTTKILGNVFKSVFSLIGAVSLAKAYMKKTLIYVLGGSFLIMGAAVVIISAPIDFILGFETTDDEDSTGDPIMDKTMHSLQEMETKWTDSLLNDTQGVDLTDYNLKYGSSYKTAAEYMPESGAPRIFWGQHNVKWNDLSGFTANPFGNFDLENDNTASFMNNINGGVELVYKTKDGSTRTSNIKEIICMADIYTMFSTEPEDTHDDGQAVDGSESANAKQSGATFAASNKKINGDLKSWASNSMIAYAQDLFNMSHQEIIDLQYVILPTKVTKDSFDPDTTVVDGENSTTVKVTQCPDYDFGGCQIYENFYYDKNGIAVKDKDGNLHTAGGVYPLRKNNMEFDEDESGNIINTEYCFADSVAGFGNIYNSDNAACWKIELQDSKSDEIEDYSEPSESGISDAVKSLTGDKEYVTGFSWSDAGYFILTTEVVGETKTHINPEWVIDVPGHPEIGHIALNPYQATDVESRTYHVTHECVGDHHGRYCGGHLKAKITGVIYGFTDAEVGAEEAGVTIAGKVEDGAFIHKDSNKFVLNDSNVFKTAQDIFDIDAACTHPNEREDWEGWTEENIELTLLKYNMDWEDLYGFDLTTTLGGQALTSADTQEIMEQIRKNYPGLSEERLSVVERGLNYVGKIGYSQTHHNCPLEGPCLISKSGPCYLSDCSGFTSNLWIDELGDIYTTDGFRTMLNGKFDSSKNLPGDIIVHYDPNGNHALLYIGEFEYDGTYQTWSIDCSTVKGVGNVFLRHRDYYDSCSYISPAP